MRTAIESGSIVSHYRIVAPIGAGGMGEVYKAHDQTLDRSVALKVLPPDVIRNEERVRRFVQEAKAASSLNHPHIVTIHEIGEAHLAGDGKPIQYIAMELIDGVTLKHKIHDEDTALRTLLGYLVQVAEGLAKAHAANIVHRDLKPENVMVTRDGYAKVLDFGLAKLVLKKSVSDTQATLAREDTREGALLGTVAYMSPEQVRGKTADHRSDIFAFGAIVYEACTRRRPFEADTDLDVMVKILHEKPVPIDELSPNVPAEVRRLVRRCMAKEPDKRYQSMKDIALELSEIVDEFEQLSSSKSSASITGPLPVQPPRRALRAAGIGAALLALAALGFGVVNWVRARNSPASQLTFSAMQIRPLTATGNIMSAAVSPDGRYLTHVTREEDGRYALWVRQVATGTDVRIAGPMPTYIGGPVFSPDGSYIQYNQREKSSGLSSAWLYEVPTLGGTPRKRLYDVDTPVSFSPDGRRIAFGRGVPQSGKNHLLIANADGTGERRLAEFQRVESPRRPAWSPDGTKVVMAASDLAQGHRLLLREIDVATGQIRAIGGPWFAMGDVQWMPDGRSILLSGANGSHGQLQLWLQPYPEGAPVRLTNDVNTYLAVSMTADGRTISAVQVQTNSSLTIGAPDDPRGGMPLTRYSSQRPYTLSVARTGVVACTFGEGAIFNIAVIDAPGGEPRFVTADGRSAFPAISVDGGTIVFASEATGKGTHIFAVNADGSGLRQVTRGGTEGWPQISGDGRTIAYLTAANELWIANADGGGARRISGRAYGMYAALSADGRLIAFSEWPGEASAKDTEPRLRIKPLDGGPLLLDIPRGGAALYRFHPDGRSLTFARFLNGAANIWSIPLRGGEPVQLTKFREANLLGYDWMPDGKLVSARADSRSDIVLITGFRK